MKILIISFILLLSNIVYSGDIPKYAVETSLKFDSVVEKTGKNDGPEIETFLKYVGLPKGNPYCMSFVVYCYHIAAVKVSKKDVLPKYGRVSLVYNIAKKNPLKYKIITPNQIILGIDKLQPGDISIHSRGGGSKVNFDGHTGIVIRQINLTFEAEEGNTGGPKGTKIPKDQGEGGGIYKKLRMIDKMNGNLGLKGWIRIKE